VTREATDHLRILCAMHAARSAIWICRNDIRVQWHMEFKSYQLAEIQLLHWPQDCVLLLTPSRPHEVHVHVESQLAQALQRGDAPPHLLILCLHLEIP